MVIEERASTHVYHQKQMLSKEELEAREALCVHEQPAYCVVSCPLKLDVKEMISAVAENDWAKARKLYEKITPFPHLLSSGCEAPCEACCKLSTLEQTDGIAIRKLEQAVLLFGQSGNMRRLPRMKKKKTTAIFGSGLFCLFLAGELQKKSYPVTILCKEASIQEYLQKETTFASDTEIEHTLLLLKTMDIQFVFSADIDHIESYRSTYDVLCASYETAVLQFEEFLVDSALAFSRKHQIVSCQTLGVLEAAFAAKRAALTVDRLAQNLDPANTRGEEGTGQTNLYTDVSEVPSSRTFLPEKDFTREQASAEAGRCIQCHCDACIKGCAYLQHYKKFPRILTREIYNNVSIIMGDHMMNKPINACSLCGQCAFTCPNGYDMGEICHMARENMVSTGKMPLAPHEFALNDMLFSNQEAFLSRMQPGFSECRYVYFPGCQASAIAPETIYKSYQDLCNRLEGGVGLVLGCCGAISDWAGRYTLARQTAKFLDSEFQKFGNPIVIAGCPTCMKELTKHETLTLTGIWDILNEIGLPFDAYPESERVALHDSCGARGNQAMQQSIRLLAQKCGCTIMDTPYSGDHSPCCGYGGLTAYANKEVADEMTKKCLERSELPYLTYCMACRDRFAREGRSSKHLLEVLYHTDAGNPPDISEKRYHRLNLKKKLLEEIWKEELPEMKCEFEVIYTDAALQMMNERMILKSDVIEVLKHLRETNESILDSETGLSITRARIGNVTFWVKYKETNEGYIIHSAYSHRMNIITR